MRGSRPAEDLSGTQVRDFSLPIALHSVVDSSLIPPGSDCGKPLAELKSNVTIPGESRTSNGLVANWQIQIFSIYLVFGMNLIMAISQSPHSTRQPVTGVDHKALDASVRNTRPRAAYNTLLPEGRPAVASPSSGSKGGSLARGSPAPCHQHNGQ